MIEINDFEERKNALRRHLIPESERPASSARGAHHIAMICSDPDTTIAFYQGVLGFPLVEIFENRDYVGSMHFFFDIGEGNLLAFFDFPGLGLGEIVEAHGGLQHLAISMTTENFEAAKLRVEAAGIEYRGPDLGVKNSIYMRDPDGIQIEILSHPLLDTNFA
ncbi:MAG: VOC family protein [Actinomycetes bacterium]